MNYEKPKNVIIIIVDSVRYYRTGADDRDRLDFMDAFQHESVELMNAFTSAPSSVMSAAAMFTGLHSAFVSRNYNDWEFDSSSIKSLQLTLKEQGFDIYSIDNSKVGREVKRDLILPLPKKLFPKGISHGKFWTNLEVTRILKHVLNNRDSDKPAFFMLWYDCREDANTSYAVEEAVSAFKTHDLFDNSIVILTSDHGYPDPRTGLNKNTMRNLRHDLVVTDDNIKIPLFIKVPNVSPGRRHSPVSTIDFTPTILDFLDLKRDIRAGNDLSGVSLKKLLLDPKLDESDSYRNRLIRTDTRLLLQSGRITAIRSSNKKLVLYQDENKIECYDVKTDPDEINPLAGNTLQTEYSELYEFFVKTNEEIDKFHSTVIKDQATKLVEKFDKKSFKNVFVCSDAGEFINAQIINVLKERNEDRNIAFWSGSGEALLYASSKKAISKPLVIDLNSLREMKFHLSFRITEKAHHAFLDNSAYELCKQISNKVCSVDFNMKPYSRLFVQWVSPIWKYRRNLNFYAEEPSLFFFDLAKVIKLFVKIFLFRDIVTNPDMSLAKELRDRALIAKAEKAKRQ